MTDPVASKFFSNAAAPRINTEIHIYNAIKSAHPNLEVLVTDFFNVNILSYIAATGDGTIKPLTASTSNLFDAKFASQGPSTTAPFIPNSNNATSSTRPSTLSHPHPNSLTLTSLNQILYHSPARRLDGGQGILTLDPLYDRFEITHKSHTYILYLVDHRDGTALYEQKRQFLLCPPDPTNLAAAYALLKTVGSYQSILHSEIWVFDSGYWQKDPGLYRAVQKSRWEDIILPQALKEDLLDTVLRFYDSHETYAHLHVPWKRGLIFYGPPGNGKTVSIKATMKTLQDRKSGTIPTLYVKSLKSFAGPEYSISQIFALARREAPCYLVFEDLDSLVTNEVRSFFLNAVDGLSENEGILMVGSTNHLERLDPGIARRPSRFDRKYLFPDPGVEERRRYCEYWRGKLGSGKGGDAVEFPEKLCRPIAELMDGFSFAYMQEAFVSTLLKIANESEHESQNDMQGDVKQKRFTDDAWDLVEMVEEIVRVQQGKDNDHKEFDKYVLWREIKVQIASLRKELDRGTD